MTILPFPNAAAETAADLKGGEAIDRYFVYNFHSPLQHTDQYTMGPEMNGEIVKACSGDLNNGLISVQRLDEYGQSLGMHIGLTFELTLLEESPQFKSRQPEEPHAETAEILDIKGHG